MGKQNYIAKTNQAPIGNKLTPDNNLSDKGLPDKNHRPNLGPSDGTYNGRRGARQRIE